MKPAINQPIPYAGKQTIMLDLILIFVALTVHMVPCILTVHLALLLPPLEKGFRRPTCEVKCSRLVCDLDVSLQV